jgi:iron(III) transport system permease protein
MPIVVLIVMIHARTIDPDLEAAARIVARWRSVLWHITLPLILPGISLAAILVFLLSMGEFSVPMFLRYDVFPVESFTEFSAFYSFDAATAASIPLVLITVLALGIEDLFLREKTYQLRPAHGQAVPIRLGTLRRPLFFLVAVLCLIFVAVPYMVLIARSGSIAVYGQAMIKAGDSLVRSVMLGVIGASILTLLGALSGYIIYKKDFRFWRAMDTLTIFLFALPSTITGAGLVSLWNRPLTNIIYQTFAIILLGYVAQYTALTSRITVAALAQIPPSMEQAAQAAGARWARRMSLIILPLARRGLIGGWIVAYIFCLRDTGISMMAYPPGGDTFTVRTFTLMANNPPELIAALCVIMIMVTLIPLAFVAFFAGR